MNVLLLTDIPPCRSLTAGLVLDQLVRFLPKGSVSSFCVVSPVYNARLSEDLDWIPVAYRKKPYEHWAGLPKQLQKSASLFFESYNSLIATKKIAKEVASFGKKFNVDLLWCVLQGQTMIRLAVPAAKALGVPLHTQVWDPPGWWLRANGVDPYSTRRILEDFDAAVSYSRVTATASWAMADYYKHRYGVHTTPFIPGIDISYALSPARDIHTHEKIIIALAGQIYATDSWNGLIRALDSVGWQINGRKVVIRLLGRNITVTTDRMMNIEFLGWHDQVQTLQLLAEADILYCPYWFDPTFADEAKLSFPSKLTTYLAAGRPVLFHGPDYASPAKFLVENKAGLCCHSLAEKDIIDAIQLLAQNSHLYGDVTINGRKAFEKYLTLDNLILSFANFLQVDPSFLRRPENNI
jgi:glycosyltransferase involved in cell wall biosynthesis